MFGPNPSTTIHLKVDYHHRESRFADIHTEALALFREKFNIPLNYEVIIFTGSGTLAVEAFIASFRGKLAIQSSNLQTERFAARWKGLLEHYGKYEASSEISMKVQFETSQSLYNGDSNATFVDAVSAFPFWSAPRSPAWSTVSSKILGAAPVLSILVVEQTFLREYLADTPSYLSPFKYLEFQKKGETPFTPAMPLFQDFRDKLRVFNLAQVREQIAENHSLLVDAIGAENLVSAELTPVLTILPGVLPEDLAKRWTLYGQGGAGKLQIFLYSEAPGEYIRLANEIRQVKREPCIPNHPSLGADTKELLR
jgi:aspartate aminotransferase-like enzyme